LLLAHPCQALIRVRVSTVSFWLFGGYITTVRAAVTKIKSQTHCLSWHHHNPVATGLLAIPPLQHPPHSSQSPGCQQLLLLQSALNSPPPSSPTAAHDARLAAQERKDGVKSVVAAADQGSAGP